MRRLRFPLLVVVLLAVAAFIFASVYAGGSKADSQQATPAASAPQREHPHQEGSPECIEAHKTGECTGHAPGQCQHGKSSASSGSSTKAEEGEHPHAEGSPECIEAHKSGKCTGHQPGQHQHPEKK